MTLTRTRTMAPGSVVQGHWIQRRRLMHLELGFFSAVANVEVR